MKKLMLTMGLAAITAIGLTGCQKECTSTCGTIVDDAILDNGCYSLSIRNSCSDNVQTFCFDQATWFTSYVGEDFCVNNVTPW